LPSSDGGSSSLAKMLVQCLLTAFSDTTSRCAIALLETSTGHLADQAGTGGPMAGYFACSTGAAG
jgi:hypothetical protein